MQSGDSEETLSPRFGLLHFKFRVDSGQRVGGHTSRALTRREKFTAPPPINRTKARAESLSPLSPIFIVFFFYFYVGPLNPSDTFTQRRKLIIDADKCASKPTEPKFLVFDEPHLVVGAQREASGEQPTSSSRGVSVPGLLETRAGRHSQAGDRR